MIELIPAESIVLAVTVSYVIACKISPTSAAVPSTTLVPFVAVKSAASSKIPFRYTFSLPTV